VKHIQNNTLFYGDNLGILREYIPDESIDLIYLDPPFNSSRSYNVLFKDESGHDSESQITAFDDSWHWGQSAESIYSELIESSNPQVSTMISAMRQFIGSNQMMAYLVMMAARLVELHRVLKPTGSLYLHCDPTASHYLKIILDTVFGVQNFQNEICWKRTSAHSSAKRYGPVHDVLLFFSKSGDFTWNPQFTPHDPDYVEKFYRHVDTEGRRYRLSDLTAAGIRHGSSGESWRGVDVTAKGNHWKYTIENLEELDKKGRIYWPPKGGVPAYKRYLDEVKGIALQDILLDIPPIGAQAAERLGYPTQKPLVLLERVIQASSNEGDIVLDPFSGCGTAIAAAQKLGRKWIGIDITHLAIAMHKLRLKDMYDLVPCKDYDVIGEPEDLGAARQLAQEDRYQFQWWALSLIQARPLGGSEGDKKGKKGSDKGIDGVITFIDDASKKAKRVLVQVKSGHVKSGDIRDLVGVLSREPDACIGVFVTLEAPTGEMTKEAATAGFYRSELWQKDYPRIQILTVEDILSGVEVKMPPTTGSFKKAQKVKKDTETEQGTLGF